MKITNKNLDEISRANIGSEVVEPIYNTDQLMDLLKVSRRTLQDWRDKGLIEFSAVRGKFYYRYSAVVKMLDNHTIKPL
ncbi:helix-turn-helix domain-containing protein [Aquirufa nivalisilvae]